jgi:AraC-like DNA-binding protein
LAAPPKGLIETPAGPGAEDVLSDVLRTIRLSGSLQFCVAASGAWQTDDKPSLARLGSGGTRTVPFHIVAEGACWLRIEDRTVALAAGDIVAFPFGTGHVVGSGAGGPVVNPTSDLPPKPWRDIPLLRYGEGQVGVRLLCGYLTCDAINFQPLRSALPVLLHARTSSAGDADWLKATVRQIVAEADNPRTGSRSLLERLTEITFIELLRHRIAEAPPGSGGWLAALADPQLGRALALIHEEPSRDWTVPALAKSAGLSRSSLAERFEAMLETSPMRYIRDWRLYLASAALATTTRPIAAIAEDAGYGTEAAFNRAFSKTYGMPPSKWRQAARSKG